ncbi:MAG TPA: SAM-dependent methyltransferase, partial [Streptosporangiaceae bacterium]|nr:SAM-dependent methyltransferase [Streptosporangiaceae bacterium]
MTRRTEQLSQELHDYLIAHSTPPDQVLRELADETASRFGASVGMQIGPEQGAFMTLLARLTGARSAIEVGTFTG